MPLLGEVIRRGGLNIHSVRDDWDISEDFIQYGLLGAFRHVRGRGHSILLVEREVGQETRYRLLETMRQYAQENLLEKLLNAQPTTIGLE